MNHEPKPQSHWLIEYGRLIRKALEESLSSDEQMKLTQYEVLADVLGPEHLPSKAEECLLMGTSPKEQLPTTSAQDRTRAAAANYLVAADSRPEIHETLARTKESGLETVCLGDVAPELASSEDARRLLFTLEGLEVTFHAVEGFESVFVKSVGDFPVNAGETRTLRLTALQHAKLHVDLHRRRITLEL